MKRILKENLSFYLISVLAVLAVKVFYQRADSDALAWILAPTAWWVRILSGIPFEKIRHVGYVSHAHRFIIAPSCAGVRFLLITFVMMVFSFEHLVLSPRKKAMWLGVCAVSSYLSTVFVNGIRITVSICLPPILMEKDLLPGWLTAERLHTIIGTGVYFSLLFVLYALAGRLFGSFFARDGQDVPRRAAGRFFTPVFWYLAMVIGLPFLVRIYRGQWEGFGQYVLLVSCVCAAVAVVSAALPRAFCQILRRLERMFARG